MDETIEKKISDTENHTSEKVEILSNKPDEDNLNDSINKSIASNKEDLSEEALEKNVLPLEQENVEIRSTLLKQNQLEESPKSSYTEKDEIEKSSSKTKQSLDKNDKQSEKEKSQKNETSLLNSNQMITVKSEKGFINNYFKAFEIEEKYLQINSFPSEALEKMAISYDLFDTQEEMNDYKFNRVLGQSTRAYWNKYKEHVEGQLIEEEAKQENKQENKNAENDSDEEESPGDNADLLEQMLNIIKSSNEKMQ